MLAHACRTGPDTQHPRDLVPRIYSSTTFRPRSRRPIPAIGPARRSRSGLQTHRQRCRFVQVRDGRQPRATAMPERHRRQSPPDQEQHPDRARHGPVRDEHDRSENRRPEPQAASPIASPCTHRPAEGSRFQAPGTPGSSPDTLVAEPRATRRRNRRWPGACTTPRRRRACAGCVAGATAGTNAMPVTASSGTSAMVRRQARHRLMLA